MKIAKNPKIKISLALFLLTFTFGIIWALIVPGNNEAPDEASHLNMIDFLRTERRIPVFNNETKIIPTQYDQGLLSGAYYSMAYNSPLSYLPFLVFTHQNSLEKPAIIPMRLISSFFIAGFAVLLFLGLCRIKPKSEKPALAVTLFISLIPQVIFSGSYINIEPVALFLSALTFYFYTWLRPDQLRSYIYFGVSLGLLALAKANYFILFGYLGLLLLFDLAQEKDRTQKIKNYLWVLVTFAAINLWWWLRNWGLYHDPLILSFIKREIIDKAPAWFRSMREQGYNVISIFSNQYFYRFTFEGFFANLGGANIFLPLYFYWLFYSIIVSLTILAFRGIKKNVVGACHCEQSEAISSKADCRVVPPRNDNVLELVKDNRKYLLSFIIITILAILYFANKNLDDFSPQGRHLFPLMVPMAVAAYFGLDSINSRVQRWLHWVLPAFSLIASLYGLFLIVNNYFIKGIAYVNESNKGDFLANFSWRHPRLDGFLDLIDLLRLPAYGICVLIFCLIVTVVSFSYLASVLVSSPPIRQAQGKIRRGSKII